MADYKKIILKNSPVPGAVPLADFLDFGELALNYADKKLYYKELDGNIVVHETPYIDIEGSQNSIVKRNGDGSGVFNGVISTISDPDLYAIDASHDNGTVARIVASGSNTSTQIISTSGIGAQISSLSGTGSIINSTSGIGAQISSASGVGAQISSASGVGAQISSASGVGAQITSTGTTEDSIGLTVSANIGSALLCEGQESLGAEISSINDTGAEIFTLNGDYHAVFGSDIANQQLIGISRSNVSIDWLKNNDRIGSLKTTNTISANCDWTLPDRSGTILLDPSPTITTPTISIINGSTAANGTLTLRSTSNATKSTAGILMTDGISSSSSSTGTLVVTGGVGVSGNLYAGGDVYANNEILATKKYVDAIAEGLHVHAQAHVILNESLETITGGAVSYDNGTDGIGAYLTLSNPINFTTGLEGDTDLQIGSRIIVNGQSPASRNGIYDITSTTRLTRAEDFNTPLEMGGGDFIFVTHGITYANTAWVLGEAVTTVGVSPVNFIQFSGPANINAGNGLIQDGTTIDVVGATGRIVANSNNIDLSTYGTAGTYKSVTVDEYGRVSGGTNPTTLSGYGITDALTNNSASTQNAYFGDIFLYDDVNPSNYLGITNSANLTSNRTLDINVNDSNRTLSFNGNLTVSSNSTISGNNTGDQTDITGNAGTATKFQTSRTINGTSFDGSANITTSTWGTGRTFTIGSSSKDIDGSTNVSWSLADIGAQPVDQDLTSIAELSGSSGFLVKTAIDTWSLDTTTINSLQTEIDTKLDKVAPIVNQNTSTTLNNDDDGKIFHASGNITFTLPLWSSISNGWSIGIVNVGGNTLTIRQNIIGNDTINGTITTFNNTVSYSGIYIYRSTTSNQFIAIGVLY